MASLEYFLVVESVSIDQATNRVSLFHVLEELGAKAFPAFVPQMVAVSSWNVPQEEWAQAIPVSLRVFAPGALEPTHEHSLTLEPGDTARRRSLFGILGFLFDQPGDWRFELLLNGTPCAHHLI